MKNILLLNDNCQVIAFVSEKKAIKLLFNNKVDVISIWRDNKIYYSRGCIDLPSVIKMKYHIQLNATKLRFSRKLVLRRDNYYCSYCGEHKKPNQLTIDHIIPRCLGGENSFTNCVAACLSCNLKKANKSLDQAGFVLNFKPQAPQKYLCGFPSNTEWHPDWLFFVRN